MTELNFPDAPYEGQAFNRWVYDGSKWVLAGGSDVGPKLLTMESYVVDQPATFMDTYSDFDLNDNNTYDFPTVFEVSVAGIWMKPDRQFNLSGQIFSYNHIIPDSPGYGGAMDSTPLIGSAGAGWTALGELGGSWLVATGANGSATLRLFGVTGGATGVGFKFSVAKKRYRLT